MAGTATDPIRVLLADDHLLMREGVAALLSGHPDMALVGEAADGMAAVSLFRELRPDITLMDVQLPDGRGLEAMAEIRRMAPQARIVVLTSHALDMLVQRALRAGVQAYLLKSAVRRDLVDILRGIHRGEQHFSPGIRGAAARQPAAQPLSSREVAVLGLVAHGHANKVIGTRLSITEETVKSHVKNILAKLGARDRTHAVRLALECGILGWDGQSA